MGGDLGSACASVFDVYGVECQECGAPSPGPYCLTVVAEDLEGTWLVGTTLQPRSCSDIISGYLSSGECENNALDYDRDAAGATDGVYQGCPEF